MEKSDAPVDVKRLATMEREPVGPEIRMTGPSVEEERDSKAVEAEEAKGEGRKGPERKVVRAAAAADDEETPAERRRREAALGIGDGGGEAESESESEGERERFRRSIRFAQ